MVKKEKIKKYLIPKLLFTYLVVFPFGVLPTLKFNLLNYVIRLHLIDVLVGIIALFAIIRKTKPRIFTVFFHFWLILALSFVFALRFFEPSQLLLGLFYLIRVLAYGLFVVAVYSFIDSKKSRKELLFNSLLVVSFFIAVFGLFQYFIYPDIRGFIILGWDDHLYRLVSTFMDPGFTVIFLVFGLLISISKYFKTKNKYLFLLALLFLSSISLTYARSGYIALIAGLGTLLIMSKEIKTLSVLVVFILLILVIPKYGSEGVRLLRTHSIFARLTSYGEAIDLFKTSPLTGIGYNNLCIAKHKLLNIPVDFESHSCSGVESGLMTILATSGILGFLFFLRLVVFSIKYTQKTDYGKVYVSCLSALLFHNLFINSIFYAFVMGYMGILLVISLKE